jgi:hypothetical protein
LTTVVQFLGESFTLDDLVLYIAGQRGKPLHVLEHPLEVATTGCCLALVDADVIVIRVGLSPSRYLNTYLHECAHFLLRHVPHVTEGAEHWTFETFLEDVNFRYVLRRTSVYDRPYEDAAESLATLLSVHIANDDMSMPLFARSLFR